MKLNHRKVWLALALAMTTGVTSIASAQTAPTELQITWWGSQARHDRTIAVIEAYEAAHPELDIVYEFANFTDYWTKVNTQAAGGQMACIMQQDYAYLAEWAERGLLMPLDPYIESGAIDTTNVSESLLNGGRVGESIYGISLGSNSQSIILDVDAFEAAGLELPSPDWTWTEFEEVSNQLHEATGVWGITSGLAGLTDIQMWKSLYVGLGERPFSEDGNSLGYTDDQPLIDYFNMVLRLQESGAIAMPDEAAEFTNAGPEGSPIVTGQAAMQYQWSNQVAAIFSAAGEDRHFRLWHLPRTEGGAPQNYLKPSMFFSITAGCETPDEAAAFINHFTNDLEANEILLAERGVPISTEVREHLVPLLDTATTEAFDFLTRVEADSSPIYPPDPTGFSNFLNNVYTPLVVDPVMYGMISAEEGVAILREQGEAVLAANE